MDGRSGDWNIFCQRFNSQGQLLGAKIQVTTDAEIQWTADVSCGLNGDFVVTWDDARNGNWDVYGQRHAADGTPRGQNFKANDDGGSGDQYASGVAVNKYGEFMVVWTDRRSGGGDAG